MPTVYHLLIEKERLIVQDLHSNLSIHAIAKKHGVARGTVSRVRDRPQPARAEPKAGDVGEAATKTASQAKALRRARLAVQAGLLRKKPWDEPEDDSDCLLSFDGELDPEEARRRYEELRKRKAVEPSPGHSLPSVSMRLECAVSERDFGLAPSRDVDQYVRGSESAAGWRRARKQRMPLMSEEAILEMELNKHATPGVDPSKKHKA